jgi:hypothetical protein
MKTDIKSIETRLFERSDAKLKRDIDTNIIKPLKIHYERFQHTPKITRDEIEIPIDQRFFIDLAEALFEHGKATCREQEISRFMSELDSVRGQVEELASQLSPQ